MAQFAQFDPSTSKSRSGWITFYAACPIIWASKLQTQVALSITEAKYITVFVSQSLHDVIPIMQLLEEMKGQGFKLFAPSLMSTARPLRIILVLFNWLASQNSILEPNTSMCVIKIFAKQCKENFSR